MTKPIVVWFRRDLRLSDHAALSAAVATGQLIVPLFVLDEISPGQWVHGGASRWWLHHSLEAFGKSLEALGGGLVLRRGAARDVVSDVVRETGAGAVYCSRGYEPWSSGLEADLRDGLADEGVTFKRFAGTLLAEPDRVTTQAGQPFKVFTPFWHAIRRLDFSTPIKAPTKLTAPPTLPKGDRLEDWGLLPKRPDWAQGLRENWSVGEQAAQARLAAFLDEAVVDYAEARDRPGVAGTSRLSPHLAFGEISARQCWFAVKAAAGRLSNADKGTEVFLKELVWREFSAHLLHHWPTFPVVAFREEYSAFPWKKDEGLLKAWQRGLTGYPIVDAGLRELWSTGWMHNRVRMIVASFLIKDLLQPWQDGEGWFWDTLVDADLGNNAASWQWVAGSGADAAPFFRIFNPVKQGETFDADGSYVRRWVPELSSLPDKFIHAPWTAPREVLDTAAITLGETYPLPIVDHAEARKHALAAFDRIKRSTEK